MGRAYFVISLDFELGWGVLESRNSSYETSLRRAREVIPQILDLFVAYDIHATWATVGLLLFESADELRSVLPQIMPNPPKYALKNVELVLGLRSSPEQGDLYFAPDLVRKILNCPSQEIGSHTFAHYLCHCPGDTEEAFRADALAMTRICERFNFSPRCVVFPKNLVKVEYLRYLRELGIRAYRGNLSDVQGQRDLPKGSTRQLLSRLLRGVDLHIKLPGRTIETQPILNSENEMVNVPATRFLSPRFFNSAFFSKQRLQRVLNEIDYAAKSQMLYHLWWHPHNFGAAPVQGLEFLAKVLQRVKYHVDNEQMVSLNISEIHDSFSTRFGSLTQNE